MHFRPTASNLCIKYHSHTNSNFLFLLGENGNTWMDFQSSISRICPHLLQVLSAVHLWRVFELPMGELEEGVTQPLQLVLGPVTEVPLGNHPCPSHEQYHHNQSSKSRSLKKISSKCRVYPPQNSTTTKKERCTMPSSTIS